MRTILLPLCLLMACAGGDLTLPSSAQPVALRIVAGDDQRAQAGTLLEEPLVVEVLDAALRPVAGATVEFAFLDELPGADLEPGIVTTDATGRAAAEVRLGAVAGEQEILARVAGSVSPDLAARFTATAFGGGGGGDDDDGHGKKDKGDKDDD